MWCARRVLKPEIKLSPKHLGGKPKGNGKGEDNVKGNCKTELGKLKTKNRKILE